MSLTTFRTWIYGELVTAAMMNQQIRDNGNAIWVGTTAGDMDYYTGATGKARIAIGDTGDVLQVVGGVPAWGAKLGAVCIAKNSGAQTFSNAPTLAETTVNLGAEDEDTHAWHNTVTNNSRVTVNEAGLYLCVGRVQWEGNTTGGRSLLLRQNGATELAYDRKQAISASDSFANFLTVAKVVRLTATQYVELLAAQSSGGNLNLNSAYLEVIRIG